MASRIEQYALIGDTQTAALVGDDGSIDWLCIPRFDSGACFAALLGSADHGRWLLGPAGGQRATNRSYRDGTLVLETEFETDTGAVRLTDCMPVRDRTVDIVRVVEGLRGRVDMRMELAIRFDYGSIVPWVRRLDDGRLLAVAGPDALVLQSPVAHRGADYTTVGEFSVAAGQRVPFALAWFPSHHDVPRPCDVERGVASTTAWWEAWSSHTKYDGDWPELVQRSLITLKALTYAPTGGIVAAATTSLPEAPGGVRNWDYRFCWLRDATFTLYSLMNAGYVVEAKAWREWLLRAVAGKPAELQILYGPAGERRVSEYELSWLPGYEGSRPVRVGNAASLQFQLDVYGELVDALYQAHRAVAATDPHSWEFTRVLLDFLEDGWRQPDEGIWEVRGPREHFTHSKVMAWVAVDRAVRAVREGAFEGPVDRWAALAAEIHGEVCTKGYDSERNTFVQAYGSRKLDASLLMLPLVAFLPADDERVQGTVAAIQRDLVDDGLVRRYAPDPSFDGLAGSEGMFLPCTFWLADNLALMGRVDEARALFERVAGLANDVGLLAEEYDPVERRQLGNFPQAFTHVGLINTAGNLSTATGAARHRSQAERHHRAGRAAPP